MKKINYQQLFYKFLVENGLLFDCLDLIRTTKYKTLKEHCTHANHKNFIYKAYLYSLKNTTGLQGGSWDNYWKQYHNKWLKLLIETKQIKTKKNEKRN